MAQVAGFPLNEVHFNKDAELVDARQIDEVKSTITDHAVTDLMVMVHGWNNDIADARALYERLLTSMRSRLDQGSAGGLAGRSLAALGLFWPSKRFTNRDLIPGGAASAGGDMESEELEEIIAGLVDFFDVADANQRLNQAKQLVTSLEDVAAKREEFFKQVQGLLGRRDDLDLDDRDEIPEEFFTNNSNEIAEIFDELAGPDPPGASTIVNEGGAVGFNLSGFRAGARRLLNYVTYYQMKKRARTIGVAAGHPLMQQLRAFKDTLRIHLIGHSFGGLFVTSIAWGGSSGPPRVPIDSMTLLQAAFSHHGFAQQFDGSKDGRYRSVLQRERVRGQILATHTHNDKSVGVAYALASRFARQNAAALGVGGSDDPFGGIGANGAQHTPEVEQRDLLGAGQPYASFEGGKFYNLLADDHIKGHSDVTNEHVAHVILEGIQDVS